MANFNHHPCLIYKMVSIRKPKSLVLKSAEPHRREGLDLLLLTRFLAGKDATKAGTNLSSKICYIVVLTPNDLPNILDDVCCPQLCASTSYCKTQQARKKKKKRKTIRATPFLGSFKISGRPKKTKSNIKTCSTHDIFCLLGPNRNTSPKTPSEQRLEIHAVDLQGPHIGPDAVGVHYGILHVAGWWPVGTGGGFFCGGKLPEKNGFGLKKATSSQFWGLSEARNGCFKRGYPYIKRELLSLRWVKPRSFLWV